MFRTRDFILFLLTIGFLLIAISSTALTSRSTSTTQSEFYFADVTDGDFVATVASEEGFSREARLASMRQKIAESSDVVISELVEDGVLDEEVVESLSTSTEDSFAREIGGLPDCNDRGVFTGNWEAGRLKTEVSEGARLFYFEAEIEVLVATGTASSAPQFGTQVRKDVQLQLPESPFLTTTPNCIKSDVVGIALDGSLIRNDEAGLYGVFGEETLVGYALDGWPIYGSTSRQLDQCGGEPNSFGYAYYLQPGSVSIINCFVSLPVSL